MPNAAGVRSFNSNVSWFRLFVWHSACKVKNVWNVIHKWFQNVIFWVKALWKIYLILCWKLSVINLDNKRSRLTAVWHIGFRYNAVFINTSYYYRLIIPFSWLSNSSFGVIFSEWCKIPLKNSQTVKKLIDFPLWFQIMTSSFYYSGLSGYCWNNDYLPEIVPQGNKSTLCKIVQIFIIFFSEKKQKTFNFFFADYMIRLIKTCFCRNKPNICRHMNVLYYFFFFFMAHVSGLISAGEARVTNMCHQ